MRRASRRRQRQRRRGSILPLVAVSFVAMCGFAALAVDVGLIAVAKTQCQNAADAAALVGARTFDGTAGEMVTTAEANARAATASNSVLNVALKTDEVTMRHGAYHYDSATQKFVPQFPPVKPDNYNLTESTVTHSARTAFASVLGVNTFRVSARSVAAHRPRDVAIVLDFSGSMNNESDLWNNESYLGSANNGPNTTDPVIPKFGAYFNATASTLRYTGSDPRVGKSNITVPVLGMPAMVDDFYQHARGASSSAKAFTPVTAYDTMGYPNTDAGDRYLAKGPASPPVPAAGSTGPAATVQEVTGASNAQVTAKTDLAMPSYPSFLGYTRGPGYWGKTFFVWPPDPATSNDWRTKFFYTDSTRTTGVSDNTKLWDGSGNWRNPSGYYAINYAAVLNWIKNTGPNPFPSQLRAGRILYYDAIPDDVPTSVYDHTKKNATITNVNQRFWKEYIDYVLGVWRDPFGNIQTPGNPACSYGPDFNFGSIKISAPVTYTTAPLTRMHPQDNPKRPRHRMWFGPMTMIQFLSDTKLLPGTAHDISLFPAKLGISGALQDVLDNHPNDQVSLILFSRPQYSSDPDAVGQFNQAQTVLGRDYAGMISALWFPPNSGTDDVRPWDANDMKTPRAYGDYTANTTTVHGFMLAYNQFSGNTALRSSGAGGWGRKGAQRLVVLETDGMANANSSPSGGFASLGSEQSYYKVRPGDSISSGGFSESALMKVVQAICNKPNGLPGTLPGYGSNPGYPGFSSGRKPVQIHAIAFGSIFEPTASGGEQSTATAMLQQISGIGGTSFPSSSTDSNNGFKWCIGTLDERKLKLRRALTRVMDDGVSVALIE